MALFFPVGFEWQRDHLLLEREDRHISWATYPGGGTKALYIEVAPINVPLRAKARVDGRTIDVHVNEPLDRLDQLPAPPSDGVYVTRCGTGRCQQHNANTVDIDEATARQLRSLGYIR